MHPLLSPIEAQSKERSWCRALQTELSWLLDDTVVGMLSADGGEQQTSWRSIERGLRINELDQQLQQLVQLRLPPEALGGLMGPAGWQERMLGVLFGKVIT